MAMHPIAQRIPYPDGTPLLNNPAALRHLAEDQGVVLLRGVISPKAISAVAELLTDAATEVGWLSAGRGLNGVHENPGDPAWQTWYNRVQRARAFHALAHDPRLLAAVAAVVGGTVLAHPRHIARCVGPDTARCTTPPHQDVWYIGGSQDIWTAWAPITDCPEDLGGLAVLPGSHQRGVLANQDAVGAGGRTVAAALDDTWAWEPLRAGDVLLFHGLTVHQGCDNRSDRLRLSMDMRFQRADLPVRADSLQPHFDIAPWEELYKEWPTDDPLRYYWRKLPLTVV